MIAPQKPYNENRRLEALRSYELLDTLPEDAYDTVTQLASHICDTPISLVTLLDADRNFLKSRLGVDMTESPRDISFCGHAILTKEPVFVVEDAREDERFADNPLVKDFKAIFYAGVPLRTSDGYALGTLCVYDHKPRKLSDAQKDALRGLAKQTVLLFEARKLNLELKNAKAEIKRRSERLEDFARLVAHDLKSPLASMQGLLNLVKEDYPAGEDSELALYVTHLDNSAQAMRTYIDGLLQFYRSDNMLALREDIALSEIVGVVQNIHRDDAVTIDIDEDLLLKGVPKIGVQQIVSNLVDNAIKYNSEEKIFIKTHAAETETYYTISVADNGVGIPKDKQELIFELFKTVGKPDKYGKNGSGMGLATVKKLVEGLGGAITVDSTPGVGSIFTFTIKR